MASPIKFMLSAEALRKLEATKEAVKKLHEKEVDVATVEKTKRKLLEELVEILFFDDDFGEQRIKDRAQVAENNQIEFLESISRSYQRLAVRDPSAFDDVFTNFVDASKDSLWDWELAKSIALGLLQEGRATPIAQQFAARVYTNNPKKPRKPKSTVETLLRDHTIARVVRILIDEFEVQLGCGAKKQEAGEVCTASSIVADIASRRWGPIEPRTVENAYRDLLEFSGLVPAASSSRADSTATSVESSN